MQLPEAGAQLSELQWQMGNGSHAHHTFLLRPAGQLGATARVTLRCAQEAEVEGVSLCVF